MVELDRGGRVLTVLIVRQLSQESVWEDARAEDDELAGRMLRSGGNGINW